MTTGDPRTAAPAGPDEAKARWAFALDPAWQPESADENAPIQAVLGAWYVEPGGSTGPFRANPDYVPSRQDSPTDPVDAALQLVCLGEYDDAALLATMRDALLHIALDEQGNAVVAPAPDQVPSVLVATSPVHANRLQVPDWREIIARDLADSLPEEGVDVLLNPGAVASMRVAASSLKQAVGDAEPAPIPGWNPFDRPGRD